MFRWKTAGLLTLGAAAVLLGAGVVLAQERGRPGGGGGGARGGFGGGGWPGAERMAEMFRERLRESLGASDEEWAVIGPRLENVTALRQQTRGGQGMRMLFGRGRGAQGEFGGRGPDRDDDPQEEPSKVEKAAGELQEALSQDSAPADQVQQKLTAYRAAREEALQELDKAQQELREVLTVRQEAQLVLMGILD